MEIAAALRLTCRDQGTVTWPWPTRYFGVQYCAMALRTMPSAL